MLSMSFVCMFGLAAYALFHVTSVANTLTVSTTGGNASSPLLHDLMFEVSLLILTRYQS